MRNIKRVQLVGWSFAICLLILASSSWGASQTVQAKPLTAGVSVGGIVFNQVTQTGAAGITVKLWYGKLGGSPSYITTSGINGSFSFAGIPQGTYVIYAFPPAGYLSVGFNISVGSTDINNLQLSLKKDLSLLSPPNQSFVEVAHPWLCWESMPQANSYWIQINRESDWLLINHPHVFYSACYRTLGPFVNGVEYSWGVASALDAQGVSIGGSGSAFLFTYKTDPVMQAINQGGDTLLTSWDGTIHFDFPPGSLDGTGTITYQRSSQPPTAHPMKAIDKAYDLSSTASLVADATYTVTITYSDRDVIGIEPETLALYAWDVGQGQWVKEPSSQLNAANHTITATPNHFSTWSVLGDTHRVFLPAIMR